MQAAFTLEPTTGKGPRGRWFQATIATRRPDKVLFTDLVDIDGDIAHQCGTCCGSSPGVFVGRAVVIEIICVIA